MRGAQHARRPRLFRTPGSTLGTVQIDVLGPIAVQVLDQAVDIGGPKQRALLAILTLHADRAVSTDLLVDALWPDAAPAGAAGTLQTYVAGLRRVLEPARTARGPATVLVTAPPGYRLRVDDGAIDAHRFEAAVGAARRAAGPLLDDAAPTLGAIPRPTVAGAVDQLSDALATWRGEPYLDLGEVPDAIAERARLTEMRLLAEEMRVAAAMALGDHAGLVGRLEQLALQHPLRERLWCLLAVALSRSGRQGDALDALRRLRATLADELGLDPGAPIRDLETAILQQDPAVQWHAYRTSGAAPPARASVGEWPVIGRGTELDQLTALLDDADRGRPGFACLIGEPGIGKSRLAAELGVMARRRGADIAVAACSQDEGAPPLWPWMAIVRDLGLDTSLEATSSADVGGSQFELWDELTRRLADAAASATTVVVFDDLHWSDTSSLRALRHLVQSVSDVRLLTVCTWRPHPAPAGALADLAATLARRHAVRLELGGLAARDTASLVESVATTTLSPAQAEILRERTDGNPFFVVEYARLLTDGDAGQLSRTAPPAGVSDVIGRRLAHLPAATARALSGAAVLGRIFEMGVLADLLHEDEDALLDALEPAREAGLLDDVDVERSRFAHALVRDTVYAALPLARRGRSHAEAAETLERRGRPAFGDRPIADIARHWLAAGDRHAGRAWRAARDAAAAAELVFAYEDAVELLDAALAALAADPAARDLDRYWLLRARLGACAAMGDVSGLQANVDEAIEIARGIGDPTLVAEAAVAPSRGSMWQPRTYGTVHEPVVAALRDAITALPTNDSRLRCQVLLSLACELYYGSSVAERDALADEAVAMARRLSDPALLSYACQMAYLATWRPSTVAARSALAAEAVRAADDAGDDAALAMALVFAGISHSEKGDGQAVFRATESARALAEPLRLSYALLVLEALEAPWFVLAGELEEGAARLRRVEALIGRTTVPHAAEAAAGVALVLQAFGGQGERLAEMIEQLRVVSRLPLLAPSVALMARFAGVERAREILGGAHIDLEVDDWFALLVWCSACEAGFRLGDPELAARAYQRTSPYAGLMCAGGSGAQQGPVDLFLAYGAAGIGNHELARRHAADAARLCEEWRIPLVAAWWQQERACHGF